MHNQTHTSYFQNHNIAVLQNTIMECLNYVVIISGDQDNQWAISTSIQRQLNWSFNLNVDISMFFRCRKAV